MKENRHLIAIFITVAGVTLMSFESLLIKLTSINALSFSFYIGILMFCSTNIILLAKQKKNILNIYKSDLQIILLCGLITGVSNICFTSAIKTTSVANTVMILASAPLFAALYSYILYKEKNTKNIYIASFFIFLGLFIIFSEQLDKGDFIGNLYALACVNLFSLTFVLLNRYKSANRFAIIAIAGFFTALFSFLLYNDFTIDTYTLLILLISGLFVVPISRVLIGIGVKDLAASEVSLLMIIETIAAPIWVWIFLNEIPHKSTFIGGAIILLTLFINSVYIIKSKKIH